MVIGVAGELANDEGSAVVGLELHGFVCCYLITYITYITCIPITSHHLPHIGLHCHYAFDPGFDMAVRESGLNIEVVVGHIQPGCIAGG